MPALLLPPHDDLSSSSSSLFTDELASPAMRLAARSPPPDSSDRKTWIALVTTGALLFLLTAAAGAWLLLLRRRRRRQQLLQHALRRYPNPSREEFARWRKMSATEREQEVERQRVIMIRKSLASRASLSTGIGGSDIGGGGDESAASSIKQGSVGAGAGDGSGNGGARSLRSMRSMGTFSLLDRMNSSVSALTIEEEDGEGEGGRRSGSTDDARRSMKLQDEWKELERSLRTQRTMSGEIHPAELALPASPPPASPRGGQGRKAVAGGPPVPSPALPPLPLTEPLRLPEPQPADAKEAAA